MQPPPAGYKPAKQIALGRSATRTSLHGGHWHPQLHPPASAQGNRTLRAPPARHRIPSPGDRATAYKKPKISNGLTRGAAVVLHCVQLVPELRTDHPVRRDGVLSHTQRCRASYTYKVLLICFIAQPQKMPKQIELPLNLNKGGGLEKEKQATSAREQGEKRGVCWDVVGAKEKCLQREYRDPGHCHEPQVFPDIQYNERPMRG
ncbi:uncharacterized protein [Dendropsophus ebraccatus]|uniref:uncharacterized protein n=1 Tax=Dendropsophus ebraccatus TaxID=150705 RepID=UPI003830FF16